MAIKNERRSKHFVGVQVLAEVGACRRTIGLEIGVSRMARARENGRAMAKEKEAEGLRSEAGHLVVNGSVQGGLKFVNPQLTAGK